MPEENKKVSAGNCLIYAVIGIGSFMILGFVLEKFMGFYYSSIEPLIKPLVYIVMTIGIIWFIASEIKK